MCLQKIIDHSYLCCLLLSRLYQFVYWSPSLYIGRHIAARKLGPPPLLSSPPPPPPDFPFTLLARGKDGDLYTMIQTDTVSCNFL